LLLGLHGLLAAALACFLDSGLQELQRPFRAGGSYKFG
jgi:hypothetical protein